MKTALALSLAAAAHCEIYLEETFASGDLSSWVESSLKSDFGKFELAASKKWNVDEKAETGLRVPEDAKFYAISRKLEKPFSNKEKSLVVQFTVKNEDMKSSGFCGGGYIKLLPTDTDLASFGGDSPYEIMFGPDICGSTSRIHTIFNHNGENLLKNKDIKLEYKDKNNLTHMFTLLLNPDNTYEVFFDGESRSKGDITDEWDFPSKTIPDPEDLKPDDWVDNAKMDDPNDKKPDGYDDIPEKIPDPEAEKPDDWDDEDDGEWEPPMIKNPEFKGKWKPKKIDNPDYKGPWVQKQIANPDFDPTVYERKEIGAVGFELWIVNSGSVFDNIFVADSLEEAQAFAKKTSDVIKEKEEEVRNEYKAAEKAKADAEAAAAEEAEEDDEEEEKEEL